MTIEGDRPAPGAARSVRRPSVPPSQRLPGPDVVRAVALVGVVVMNYHGYLINRGGERRSDGVAGVFDPFAGPLSTRFAATFVLTAGVGITLLTRRALADRAAGAPGAPEAVTAMRWRLVRRGMVLYLLGLYLDVIWPGTIILYYGWMFAVAALLFTLASRWLVALGVVVTLAAWALRGWAVARTRDGGDVGWLLSPGAGSIRRYLVDVWLVGTHPLLPWLGFLCAGIVLGRHLATPDWRLRSIALGATLLGAASLVGALVAGDGADEVTGALASTDPADRGLPYVASALGSALVAFAVVSWLADRATGTAARLVDPFRRAGQMTLTLYVAHVLVFLLLVDSLGWIEPAGLGTSLGFALAFWVVLIVAGAAWHRRFGRGPAERIYRALGD